MGVKILSLFDGISCGQIALNRVGVKYDKYYASEINKDAIKVTQYNYPNTIQLGNVVRLKKYLDSEIEVLERLICSSWVKDECKELAVHCIDIKTEGIDFMFGGSPCTGFSLAGKQLNFDDPQSKLFFEFIEIKHILNPSYIFLENVKMKKEFQDIITEFMELPPVLINSSLVSAQNRQRNYWSNLQIESIKDKNLFLKDITEGEVDKKYDITERFFKKKEGTLAYKKAYLNLRSLDQKSKTLLCGGHGISNSGSTNIFINDDYIRIPTPLECERLQTLPENYTNIGLIDSKRYGLIGNGWTVDVIVEFFKNLPKKYFL
jgi:site-specific DNA-cytosine methylase